MLGFASWLVAGARGVTQMKRRDFLVLAGATAATWPLPTVPVRAQPSSRKRIGLLYARAESDPLARLWVQAFWQGMAKQGWTERTVAADYRWSADTPEAAAAPARELAALRPDVLCGATSPPLIALTSVTKTIPIVFSFVSGTTLTNVFGIRNFSRPTANFTGFVNVQDDEVRAKSIDLLCDLIPAADRVAVMYAPASVPGGETVFLSSFNELARQRGLVVVPFPVRTTSDISTAVARIVAQAPLGLIVSGDAYMTSNRALAISEVASHRLIAIWQQQANTTDGGLISYAGDVEYAYRGAGEYVGLILRGSKPQELPIQTCPLVLTVNVKTAKSLGIILPLSILARADVVIE
jgi:putative ABC transport system substrate-binding protein